MKRHFGFVLIIMTSSHNGLTIEMSMKATSLPTSSEIDATAEIETIVKESQGYSAHDLEGVQNIVGAFTQMLANFAHVMCNPNNPVIAAAGITNILSNTFKVILELAKHKNLSLKDELIYPTKNNPHACQTLAALEQELAEKQYADFDPTSQAILTNFAGMIGEFAKIVAQPHDPHVLGSGIANLLSGMLTIAVQVTRTHMLNQNQLEELFAQDTPQFQEIGLLIQNEVKRARMISVSSTDADEHVVA